MLRNILLLLMSAALIIAVSSPAARAQENLLPAPTGPYQVGVTSLALTDESRDEIFTSDPGDKRAVTVWIWYPADVAEDAKPSPYLMEGFDVDHSTFAVEVKWYGGNIASTLEGLNTLQLHAFPDAAVSNSQETYPVVVYSNIASGLPILQSLQLVELASHGYVVVDVIHTFGYRVDDPPFQVNGIPIDFTTLETTAAQDMHFVLDQLEFLDSNVPENPFSGRFNLDQIGVAGWSSGGSVALATAGEDNRIKAGISQDGDSARAVEQPFMFMQAESDLGGTYSKANGPAYLLKIAGSRHGSYTDMVLWPHEKTARRVLGTIEGLRAVEIINVYIVAFFDQYLKGEEQPLLEGPSGEYPEVTIESRNTG